MGKSGNFGGNREKIMLYFHESLFLTLEFSKCVTQLYRISKGKESFNLSIISKGKMTNLKDRVFFKKKNYVVNPPCLDFSRIAQQSLVIS